MGIFNPSGEIVKCLVSTKNHIRSLMHEHARFVGLQQGRTGESGLARPVTRSLLGRPQALRGVGLVFGFLT